MDEKKEDLLFASPEYIDGRPLENSKLTLRKDFNILGIIRLIFGNVRNSSGQKDNMLMCVYISVVIFVAGIWWATHLEVKHSININNIKQETTKKAPNKTIPSKRHPTGISRKSQTSKVNVQINAPAPTPLPSAYYYVLFGLVLLFVIAYYARREAGRKFILNLTQAATGNKLETIGDNLKSTMIGYVETAVSKVTPTPTTPTTTTPSTSTESPTTEDGGRH